MHQLHYSKLSSEIKWDNKRPNVCSFMNPRSNASLIRLYRNPFAPLLESKVCNWTLIFKLKKLSQVYILQQPPCIRIKQFLNFCWHSACIIIFCCHLVNTRIEHSINTRSPLMLDHLVNTARRISFINQLPI